jgi:hypothetical protein
MKRPDTEPELHSRPRPAEVVSVKLPSDLLATLRRIGQTRDMPQDALIRFYISQGLRADLTRLAGEHMLEATAEALERRRLPPEEIEEILADIRAQNKRRWYPWLTEPSSTEI